MTVDVKNYAWHRDYHDRMMGNPAYQRYSFEVRGVYQTIRNLAGQTNNNGSIRVGGDTALTVDQLVDYLACVPGTTKRRIRAIIEQLLHDNFLATRRNLAVFVVGWAEEQSAAPSYEAQKKRDQRARKYMEDSGDGGGEAPPPVPAPARFSASARLGDMSPRGKGTCPPRTETETEELRKETSVSPNPNAEAETEKTGRGQQSGVGSGSVPGAFGSEAGAGTGGGASRDLPSDPILRACRLCNEFTDLARNTWKARRNQLIEKLGAELGADMFDHATNVLAQMLREGKVRREPSRVLNGIVKKMLEGGHP